MYRKNLSKGKLVYELSKELAANPSRVAITQALTLDRSKPSAGLRGRHGLFASEEWWQSLELGLIPTQIHSGIIQELYVAGMDTDEDEGKDFDYLCEDGKVRSETCMANDEIDLSLFRVGARVTVAYALDELKRQPAKDGGVNFAEILLEIAIE